MYRLRSNPSRFIVFAFMYPFILLNRGIRGFFKSIIRNERLNVLKMNDTHLKYIMSVVVFLEYFVFWTSIFSLINFAILPLAVLHPALAILGIIIAFVGKIAAFLSFKNFLTCWGISEIYEVDVNHLLDINPLVNIQVVPVRQNLEAVDALRIENSLKKAIDSLDITDVIDLLAEYSRDNPSQPYYWDDIFEETLYSPRSIWQQLDPSLVMQVENAYEGSSIYSDITCSLKRIPVIVEVNGVKYKDDFLSLLKRLHEQNGLIRERFAETKIKYSQISIDKDSVDLSKVIIAKVNDINSVMFKNTIDSAIASNNFKNVLLHLQQAEIKFKLDARALYWGANMQTLLDDFNANGLNGDGQPREHCCNMTLKLMRNPVYIIDEKNSKKIHYELLPLLEWISKYNRLPAEQSDNQAIVSNNTLIEPSTLLSQIHFDDELKNTLDAKYYNSQSLSLNSASTNATLSAVRGAMRRAMFLS